MKYITRGDSSPQGKPKVYFTGHPKDCSAYLDSISKMILDLHNCAIFYDEDPEHPEDEENFISDLDSMQLIVLVVTSRYVYSKTFAHDVVFKHAIEKHIPVLPILEESGIEADFNKKCGDLQFLNPHSRDTTEISFEEKLKKFLDAILIGDELAEKVRKAFDAYVFLSYRKKDRRYAQELMRLIHSNDFCRDIAIWYDEFLVPGENFNDAIKDAMEKSELFALAVTPNLLEKPNYVMTTEYPAAIEAGKKIIPAVLESTNEEKLKECYKNIPDTVDTSDSKALADALSDALKNIAVLDNDGDPQHMFFIGLAYLGGIDVEVDHERAVEMITYAAEKELPEAIEKLVNMYRMGEGVSRSYKTAIEWQRKLVEVRKKEYEKEPDEEKGIIWLSAVWELGDSMRIIGRNSEVEKIYKEMLGVSQKIYDDFGTGRANACISLCYNCLGNICEARSDLSGAREYYEKALEIDKCLVEQQLDFAYVSRNLYTSYKNLGKICEIQEDFSGVREYYQKSLEINKCLAEQHPDHYMIQRDLSVSYDNLGNFCKTILYFDGAKECYEKSLEIRKRLAERHPDSVQTQRDLSTSYNNLGTFSETFRAITDAREYYVKSFVIRERLAKQQPESVEAQRDLAIGYEKLGDICIIPEELPMQKRYYKKAFELFKSVADQLKTANAYADLADGYYRLSVIAQTGTVRKKYLRLAADIWQRLVKQCPDVPEYADKLEIIQKFIEE